jgi:hypothetical protein
MTRRDFRSLALRGEGIMRKGALLLAVLFAASLPSVADAAKAKRSKAKAAPVAAEADPNAALKLVLTEGLPGFIVPTPLKPIWFQHVEEQKKAAAPPARRRARR